MSEIRIQRFVRVKNAHKNFCSIPFVTFPLQNERTFEQFQKLMLEKQTRMITYRFLRSVLQCHPESPLHQISYSKLVSIFLSTFLMYHFPMEVLSSHETSSEKAVLSSAKLLVQWLAKHHSAKVGVHVHQFHCMLIEYKTRFDAWLIEDRQSQLQILCELIIQLRTHGPNTTDVSVRNTYVENAKAFEEQIIKHIRKIAGESGVQFVIQFIQGVEKAQHKIASQVSLTMHRVYWDMMNEQLSKPQQRITCVIQIVKEMKNQLIELTKSETIQRKIHEDIDVQYLELKMINGTFDKTVLNQLVEHFTYHLLQLCSPAQDHDVHKNKENMLDLLKQEKYEWSTLTTFFQCIAKHIEIIRNITQQLSK